MGVTSFIYTNISRDGTGAGAETLSPQQVKAACACEVIASGGVHRLEDIRQVRLAGLDGVIVGRALYEGRFTLQEALAC
jgi:phosphoribosylformimino-5-aminoimidazole carboxamide ribotide isomerase